MKLVGFGLKNFKAFGEHTTIPIKPITLIFGPNSAGKSSLFQFVNILRQTQELPFRRKLLPNGKYVSVGNRNDFIFRNDTDNKLEYSFKFFTGNLFNFNDLNYILSDLTGLDPYSINEEEVNDGIKKLLEISNAFDWMKVTVRLDEDMDLKELLFFIDDNEDCTSEPLYKYGHFEDELKFKLNFNHKFWMQYYQIMHSWNNDIIRSQGEELIQSNTVDIIYKDQLDSFKTYSSKEENEFNKALFYYDIFFKNHWFNEFKGLCPSEFQDLSIHQLVFSQGNIPNLTCGHPGLLMWFALIYLSSELKFMRHIGPLRTPAQRYYEYDVVNTYNVGQSGEHTHNVLFHREYLEEEELSKSLYGTKGKDVELGKHFDSVNDLLQIVHKDTKLELERYYDEHKTEKDVFSVNILEGDRKTNLINCGFGYSQILPILTQCALGGSIMIEQPELHIHPKWQAELGDVFIRSKSNDRSLLIETHSEHLILRILRRIRESHDNECEDKRLAIRSDDVAIIYIEPNDKGSKVTEISLTQDGEFKEPWPGGFFPERVKELF